MRDEIGIGMKKASRSRVKAASGGFCASGAGFP